IVPIDDEARGHSDDASLQVVPDDELSPGKDFEMGADLLFPPWLGGRIDREAEGADAGVVLQPRRPDFETIVTGKVGGHRSESVSVNPRSSCGHGLPCREPTAGAAAGQMLPPDVV